MASSASAPLATPIEGLEEAAETWAADTKLLQPAAPTKQPAPPLQAAPPPQAAPPQQSAPAQQPVPMQQAVTNERQTEDQRSKEWKPLNHQPATTEIDLCVER